MPPTPFHLNTQNEFSIEGIGYSFNTYSFSSDKVEDEILMDFFLNGNFIDKDFHAIMRKRLDFKAPFLKPPFDFNNIVFSDWQRFDKDGALAFIWKNFSPDLEDNRNLDLEKKVFEEIKHTMNQTSAKDYYTLSLDFFDLSHDKQLNMVSNKISGYDATIYTFYFLVSWVDIDKQVIVVGEFMND